MPEFTNETQFTGKFGSAWQLTISPENRNAKFSVASWLVYAPYAHPLWSYHTIDVIRLIDDPDTGDEAYRRFPGATHELIVLALDPEYQPYDRDGVNKRIRENRSISFLTPPDVKEQFEATDDEMDLIARACAWAVTVGVLIPDSDGRQGWLTSITRTLAHQRGEEHVK